MGDQSTPLAPHVQTGKEALQPLFGVCVGFMVVDTVFMFLRFYTVLRLRRKRLALTWDDWLLIPAYILNMGMLANGLVIQQYGIKNNSLAGVPITDPAQNFPIWKGLFVITQLKNPSFAFTRFSLLALFLRIFRTRFIRLTCYFLIAFVVAQTLAFNIAGIFQCSPIEYFWTQGLGPQIPGSCFNFNMFYRALVPPEIFVDVILIFLPLPEIWKLKSSKSRKWGLTILFLSGCLALMSNCARLASYWRHTIKGAVPSVENAIVGWCNSEMSVCFIVACVPAMHPLFQRLVPSSIREGVQKRMPWGRHMPQPSASAVLSSATSNGGFSKLRSDGTSSPAFGEPQRYNAKVSKGGDVMELEEGNAGMDLRHLMDVKGGQGVLVQTEIMVTQEELIEDVLGF